MIVQEIHSAIVAGNIDALITILRSNPRYLNAVIYNGNTPLHLAVETRNLMLVQALLTEPGIDIHLARTPGDGKTALDIANDNHHSGIINLLTEKDFLLTLSRRQDLGHDLLDQIAADPMVNSPLLSRKPGVGVSDDKRRVFPSYSQYLRSLKVFPQQVIFIQYLFQLTKFTPTSSVPKTLPITKAERELAEASRTWSDVVSAAEDHHTALAQTGNVKAIIYDRLARLGYTENLHLIYHECISYLKNNSAIVVTFHAANIKNELVHYRLINLGERIEDVRSESYRAKRKETEKELFSWLAQPIQDKLERYPAARPRYGALILLDRNQNIGPITNYGRSFVVFRDVVKFNSLYNPGDSLDLRSQTGRSVTSTTYHHLEHLLLSCSDALLNALAYKSVKRRFPDNFSQQYHGRNMDKGGYIEVMLPPVNVFDPAYVQHIHFHSGECTLTSDELQSITNHGITVTNTDVTPYPQLNVQFMSAVESNQHATVKRLLASYPSLAFISNASGIEPLDIAAQLGHKETIHLFLKMVPRTEIVDKKAYLEAISRGDRMYVIRVLRTARASLNKPIHNGSTTLHLAVEGGDFDLVNALTALPDIDIDVIRPLDGKTPLDIARANGRTDIVNLIEERKPRFTPQAPPVRDVPPVPPIPQPAPARQPEPVLQPLPDNRAPLVQQPPLDWNVMRIFLDILGLAAVAVGILLLISPPGGLWGTACGIACLLAGAGIFATRRYTPTNNPEPLPAPQF